MLYHPNATLYQATNRSRSGISPLVLMIICSAGIDLPASSIPFLIITGSP